MNGELVPFPCPCVPAPAEGCPCERSRTGPPMANISSASAAMRSHPEDVGLRNQRSRAQGCRRPSPFSPVRRATSETAPTLLLFPEWPPEDDEVQAHEPDFIATLDGQRNELVCSLGPFIAYLAMSLPKMLRPSALRRSAPLRDCGGYSRWRK